MISVEPHPPALPDSIPAQKRKRYLRWDLNPQSVQPELGQWRTLIEASKKSLAEVAAEAATVEAEHKLLQDHSCAHLSSLARDRKEAQQLTKCLLALAAAEATLVPPLPTYCLCSLTDPSP